MKIHCRFCTFLILFVCTLIAVVSGCKTSPPSAPADTPPTVAITSPGQGETCRLTDTVIVNASDDRGITKVELYVNGTLVVTANSEPWSFLFNTELLDDGDYSLQAKAYDTGGHISSSPTITITILNAFPATFINTVFTPISITVSSVTRTIQPGDSITFEFSTNPRSLVYSATTRGQYSGYGVGGTLNWGGSSNPINVSSRISYRASLQFSSSVFFIYLRNNGHTTLGPLYVNYQLTDQSTDYIYIPFDNTKYPLGYYPAHTNTSIWALWSDGYYASTWTQGSEFTFPWTTNQSLSLVNTHPLSKSANTIDGQARTYAGKATVEFGMSKVRIDGADILLAHEW